VLHNDMEPTGYFATSNSLVNRLQGAIRWSQRDNAFDLPTDCPQRDERLGWTGDANFFLPTATFNFDEAAFIEKWMGDVVDAQRPDGRFTVYAPAPDDAGDAAAYSDAGVICPWIIYERYGDTGILADNYAAMNAWVEYQRRTSADLIRPATGYGDWLAPVLPGEPKKETARDLIGTAYFARTADLTARAAEILGHSTDAARLQALHREIVAAFQRRFLDPQGRLTNDTQAAYALALAFDLLPEPAREAAVRHLVEDIRAHQWRMATGFVGTPWLMRVLGRYGQDDAAYRLLLSREYPGWLYMIDQGATTIWERWNSYRPETGFGEKIADTGFGDVKMNSFNHTVWGSVGEWMYAVIGGIEPAAPGFQRIRIHPRPGGDLTWAKAELDSPYGRIATDWKRRGERWTLRASIPPNTRAEIELPNGQRQEVGAGNHTFDIALPPGS
jgi:alpha-L-rhamnosidase